MDSSADKAISSKGKVKYLGRQNLRKVYTNKLSEENEK